MANIRQILHRKNSSGTYDTIYLQSDLGNVTGTLGVSNGGTGNTSVDTTPTSGSTKMCTSGGIYTELNTLKTSVSNGKAAVASAITDKGVSTSATAEFSIMAANIRSIATGAPAYLVVTTSTGASVTITNATSGETHTGTASSSGTVSFQIYSIGTWNVIATLSGKTATSSVNVTGQYPVKVVFCPEWYATLKSMSVGQTVTIDGMVWLLVNKTSGAIVLGLNTIYSNTMFRSDGTSAYAGSTLASAAADFETNQLSNATKEVLNNVTVNNVTAKVFIPSYEQMTGGFSHYNNDVNRKCQYNGSNALYWTSSAYSVSSVYSVSDLGNVSRNDFPARNYGFRPHIEVNLTL